MFLGEAPFHPRRSGGPQEKNGDCRAQEEEGRLQYLLSGFLVECGKDLPVQQKRQHGGRECSRPKGFSHMKEA